MGHKVESCPYKIKSSPVEDRNDEEGKNHDDEEHSAQEKDAFGPWVLVTRKRQNQKKVMKEETQAPRSGMPAHNSMSLNANRPSSPTLGLGKVVFVSKEGKQKPGELAEPQGMDNPSCASNLAVSQGMDKSNHVTPVQKDKKVGHSQKAKKKGRDSLNRASGSSFSPTTWKVVNSNPFALSSEIAIKPNIIRTSFTSDTSFKEFKAGGSSPSVEAPSETEVMEKVVDIGSSGQMTEMSEQSVQKIQVKGTSDSLACTDHGPSLEATSARITCYPLRRIDPNLRSGKVVMDEDEPECNALTQADQMGDFDTPTEDMQFDKGGDSTATS